MKKKAKRTSKSKSLKKKKSNMKEIVEITNKLIEEELKLKKSITNRFKEKESDSEENIYNKKPPNNISEGNLNKDLQINMEKIDTNLINISTKNNYINDNKIINTKNSKSSNNIKLEDVDEYLKIIYGKEDNCVIKPDEFEKKKLNNLYSDEKKNISDENDFRTGIADIEYFKDIINKNQGSKIYLENQFIFRDVVGDGNCGYRAIAIQLFENESYHNIIRQHVYEYLKINKDQFIDFIFDTDNKLLNNEEYIEKIKNDKFWMGDLEMSVLPQIYDATILVFELTPNGYVKLIYSYGDIYNNSKIFLTLCFVNGNHFNVLYEKKNILSENNMNKNIDKKKLERDVKSNIIKKDKIEIKRIYANDNEKSKFEDIYAYLQAKSFNNEGVYPEYIYRIEGYDTRKNKKKEFKRVCSKYFIDPKTKRLKIIQKYNTKNGLIKKEQFVAFKIEKNNIIKNLHDESMHKGNQILYNLIRNSEYWWNGIYEDVRNYIKNCSVCQSLHTVKHRKPVNLQIISNGPKDRYVMDLVDVSSDIQDNKKYYKYIMNIIDHYSKLVGSFLLEKKTAQNVLYAINEFISLYGEPNILQCDNGKEFNNKILTEYCENKNIKLLHSGVRHPTTNGVVEAVHKDIVNSLTANKMEKRDKYDIKLALPLAVRAHNNNIHSVTKYSPLYLFYNNTEEIIKEVQENMKKSQIHLKDNINPLPENSKVLISGRYQRKGDSLYVKFNNTGKTFIPGIVSAKGRGSTYPVKVSVNYNDLVKDKIYNVDYKLIKEINEKVYNDITNNFITITNIINTLSDNNLKDENLNHEDIE